MEIVVQNVYRIRENEIHNWWLWTRKMYWGLGLLPGTSQKWKVSPMGKSRLCAKSGICFNWIKCLFWHFPGRELFLLFRYVYNADFCRNWICKLVAFSLCSISNCKVFSLYTNYTIPYILCSVNQQTTISSIYPYCSITYYTQYLVFNHSFKPQYIVLPGTVVPIRVLPAQAHARARTRFRVFLKIL